MTEVFLDTNVIIDFFIDRKPFSQYAFELFSLIENKKVKASVSAISYTNIYYVLRKYAGHQVIINNLALLSQLCKVLPVDGMTLQKAIKSNFSDFEDAVQYHAAMQNKNCKIIITRDKKDFKHSELTIMTPKTFLRSLNSPLTPPLT